MNSPKPINWKIFFILLGAGILGVVAILPYSLDLQKDLLARISVPLWLIILSPIIQNTILLALAVGIGLLLARKIGLGLPILEAKLNGESVGARLRAILPISVVLGVLGSVLIVGLDIYIFGPAMKSALGEQSGLVNIQGQQPAAWKGFLASFYGGIDEEILLRLFLMSLLAWLGKFISKTSDGRPTSLVFWCANILAAVAFGLGHLPATATLLPLTPLVVLRAVVLNGLVGIAFGYLYWKHGLESAMISHFSADLVLHVLLAL